MRIFFEKIKTYRLNIFKRVFLEVYIILTYPIFFLIALLLKILNIKMLNIVFDIIHLTLICCKLISLAISSTDLLLLRNCRIISLISFLLFCLMYCEN